MTKIKLTQVRSMIKRPKDQKSTLKSLGLGITNKTVIIETNAQLEGMINKVKHLVKIEKV